MTTMLATPSDVFDNLALVYDDQPNPLLALEHHYLSRMLPDVGGLDVLDAGCGTGRWLQLLAQHRPASLVGVDTSPQMLQRASSKLGTVSTTLCLGSCVALPVQSATVDLVLASFVLSYLDSVETFARELHRVTRPGATIFVTDMHPDTTISCDWNGSFSAGGLEEEIHTKRTSLQQISDIFLACGFELLTRIEPRFDSPKKTAFEQNEKTKSYELSLNLPAIYILQLRKALIPTLRLHNQSESSETLRIRGANYALGPQTRADASIAIVHGHIQSISSLAPGYEINTSSVTNVDLSGYLLLPGLINAHDHLELGLFPNLGAGPYQNSIEWAREIHRTHASLIARHRKIPKAVRLWWGGIRNLLCGVTTVCHHNPLSRELLSADFPVRVLSKFGWAHSLEMDPNLIHNFDHTPSNLPFVLHAAEGVDAKSAQEIFDLDRMQVLDDRTILVHGLALNPKSVALLNRRHSALVVCPSSNQFLFHCTPSSTLIKSINAVILGSDSPLTSAGDLLDEIIFARDEIGIDTNSLYEMVTERSANVFRLRNGEGHLKTGSVADIIAVKDKGLTPAETIGQLTFDRVELVILSGRVQLASPLLYERLPDSLKVGLQPLNIEGHRRWLRAPVDSMLAEARKVLGRDIRLGGKKVDHADAASGPEV
jgi:ubiquinone/menaquinone biosynthesis C-methylase UbiE/cytosine/adenosine deaminase-related metal-dependent hydrolase